MSAPEQADFSVLTELVQGLPLDFAESITKRAGDLRKGSFLLALAMAKRIGAHTIVETGTIRFADSRDGYSTFLFAEYAHRFGAKFYSVDITPEHIEASKKALDTLCTQVEYVCSDSVTWLSRFCAPIDLLYLDSYDFSFENPGPSQRHELAELGAAFGKVNNPGLILLDDCGVAHEGKGYLGTRFLQDRGWKLIFDGYQRLFINF